MRLAVRAMITMTLVLAFVVVAADVATPAVAPTSTSTSTPSLASIAVDRWRGCTVVYEVVGDGEPSARVMRALQTAVRDTQRASGIQFRLTSDPVAARLTIHLTDETPAKRRWELGHASTTVSPSRRQILDAEIQIWRRAHRLDTRALRNLYRHELGHALGLKHVSTRSKDVMSPVVTPGRTTTGWAKQLRQRYQHCRR